VLSAVRRGWGVIAAGVVLVAFLTVQLFAPQAFEAPRLALFDLYVQTAPRNNSTTPVIVVAVDQASLGKVGQWPWPRQILAELITDIQRDHPAALGVDLLWTEPDKESPEEWATRAGLPPAVVAALKHLPSHDGLLAEALGQGPVTIGFLGVREGASQKDEGVLAPFRIIGGDGVAPAAGLPSFPSALRSIPRLDGVVAGHGLLSVDLGQDRVVRRLPLVSSVSGRLAPSLDLDVLRLAANAPWIDLYLHGGSIEDVGVGGLKIPTDKDGAVWIDYSPHDEKRFIPAADVLSGRVKPKALDGKLVLIGVTGEGVIDQQRTPMGILPGTEIDAQFLENVVDARMARRPDSAWFAEPALTAAMGLLFILALPRVSRRWQAPIVLAPIALAIGAGFVLWSRYRLLLDVATPAIGALAALVALVTGALAEADAQRRRLRAELEERRLAQARADGELEAGRRIQLGILPSPDDVADDRRLDLAALMVPARQIGGDMYDFFKIDVDHLFFAVGDVSGKGVPASLFMALGKSLCKSCALRGEADVGAIINHANREISRDNPEMMFITLFAGVLNLSTGEMQFCNAGHDAPFLLRPGEPPRTLQGDGGPPLCVLEDYVYAAETCALRPGDSICLITDGVTEAMNGQGELMGRFRVEALLAELEPDAGPQETIDWLQAGVDGFVFGAEPSDDLTMLALRWRGPGA
jgi:serine phosphatase RsbU (regulator of sigma subunit)